MHQTPRAQEKVLKWHAPRPCSSGCAVSPVPAQACALTGASNPKNCSCIGKVCLWLLQDEGFGEMKDLVAFYRENAAILRKTFLDLGFSVYGGENAPYIWVGFPGKPSWDVFAEILEKCNIVTTPGSGFGPAGEGFVRASAFGHRCEPLLS